MSVALGDVCSFLNGGTPSRSVARYFEGDIPWITGADIVGPIVDSARSYITKEAVSGSATNLVPAGTILLVTRTSVGKVAVAGMPLCFSQDITALTADSEKIDTAYLVHLLRTKQPHFERLARGATIKGITREAIVDIRLELPPLPEQQRIAEILDKADALRAKRRAALSQLDTLTQSIFFDMFGDPATNPKDWRTTTLGDLAAEFRYGSSNKSANQGKPALRIPNVAGGTIDLTDLKLVPVDDAEFERLRLQDGDLLFVRTNGNPDFVGRCAVFDGNAAATSGFDGNEFIFSSYLIRARFAADVISPVFLREYLLGAEGRRQLRLRSRTSAGQFNINTESLGGIPVPLPPIEAQREFARRVGAVGNSKTAHRASLAELDALFSALQHRAFRGVL